MLTNTTHTKDKGNNRKQFPLIPSPLFQLEILFDWFFTIEQLSDNFLACLSLEQILDSCSNNFLFMLEKQTKQ
jgi:hypothetical protein